MKRLARHWRYTQFLLKEFRWPLAAFVALVMGGGLSIRLLHEHEYTYGEACYQIFTMIFLEPGNIFPRNVPLQIVYYLTPILGLFVIADSLVRFGLLLFQKKAHLKEWWVMEASTYRNHVIVAGVGKVGYRVIRELRGLGELVVGIERAPDKLLVKELQDAGVPILVGEARVRSTLVEANVAHASAIICATNDDLANLDVALTARELRPSIRVVLRIFDDTLAEKFASVFKMPAISTSQTAAHVFVAAATGRSVYYSFRLDRAEIQLADLRIAPGSKLAGRSIRELESSSGARVVCHSAKDVPDLHPAPETLVQTDDTIVVMADGKHLQELERLNRG